MGSAPDLGLVLDEDAAARRAHALRRDLAAAGVRPGDRIASVAGNGWGAIAARDAAAADDLILAPINPRLAPAEIAWLARHARPRAIAVEPAYLEAVHAAAPHLPLIALDDRELAGPPLDLGRIGGTLLYTSGTTGRPKGCWRTAAQERARTDELRASYALAATDVHLIVCPLAHSAPGIFLRAARAVGARTVVLARFDPAGLLAAIAHHRATVIFLVPTQIHRLLALPDDLRASFDLSSLRAVIVAGAPFPPATKRAAQAWLGAAILYEFYGSSETGTVSVIGPGDHDRHPGSVGRAPAGVDVQVRDVDGAPVAPGEVGELFVASPAVMAGYLDDDGANLVPRSSSLVSVGDLGRIDDGWITLVDRKHDTIISGGQNVYPAEVERALAAHPAIAGAVVFGVDDPDWGQIVAAVLVARDQPLDGHALRDHLRADLAAYKLPRAVAWCAIDELPIGSSGKALRRAARAAFAARLVPIT
ncbi:MAG: AMP-binding protein [Deltaproteobacteria bacterium]|nr:AMP-binding protein [Deltaproteobacteria bacterium]